MVKSLIFTVVRSTSESPFFHFLCSKVIDVIFEQPLKADLQIVTTFAGITIVVSPVQLQKAYFSIVSIFAGIEIDVSPVHPSNAQSPIILKVDESVTDLRPVNCN